MKRRDFIKVLCGASVAFPLTVRAQPPAIPTLGYLHAGSADRNSSLVAAFRQGLSETGYVEGRNIAIEYSWAEDQYDRLSALAAYLVRSNVALIAATGTSAVLAARKATSTLPIVFNFASDPVELGLVASLSQPGRNITGITSSSAELAPKQLELLHRLVAPASKFALLVNPTNFTLAEFISRDLHVAARRLEVQLDVMPASSERELNEAFANIAKFRTSGLVIGADSFLDGRIEQIAALTFRQEVPAIYQFREFAAAGGLMSYGTVHTDPYRQSGIYAGKILGGANPGDLPVQQPARFNLVVNLKTARAFGLEVPRALLVRADEVIE
jgi:putative tryptophan/tyrosine transport system substrate-binding protein